MRRRKPLRQSESRRPQEYPNRPPPSRREDASLPYLQNQNERSLCDVVTYEKHSAIQMAIAS